MGVLTSGSQMGVNPFNCNNKFWIPRAERKSFSNKRINKQDDEKILDHLRVLKLTKDVSEWTKVDDNSPNGHRSCAKVHRLQISRSSKVFPSKPN